jgi:hypothetical protein
LPLHRQGIDRVAWGWSYTPLIREQLVPFGSLYPFTGFRCRVSVFRENGVTTKIISGVEKIASYMDSNKVTGVRSEKLKIRYLNTDT